MSLTETILFLITGIHGAVFIWLCFERDKIFKKIKELEAKNRESLSDDSAIALVKSHSLCVGDWSRNGLSVLRATEQAHGIGAKP